MIDARVKRGLLFGLRAYENDLITRDQLLDLMEQWSSESASIGFCELLVQEKLVPAETCAQINLLLDRQLESAEPELQQLFTELSSSGLKLDLLQATRSNLEIYSIVDSIATSDSFELDSEILASQTFTGPATQRFKILQKHAQGGLGVVSIAVDQELNRQVALKQIRKDRADEKYYRSKFVLEAEVTGGLEHPGIVPVYGFGVDPENGQPYYAMRFIKGDNLKKHIGDFHERHKTENLDNLKLRQLLRRFVDICNAISYAHHRGVLHRDLKPGNIMLGKHGETLVVDWGLAKTGGQQDFESMDPDESPLTTSEGSRSSETRMGSAIGSPSYAPPEQLTGDLDRIDNRSDVYGLGAILYELLVGHSPLAGFSEPRSELVNFVMDGKIASAIEANPRVPKGLSLICAKAMNVKPVNRYQSVLSLRDDIEGWMADQPVSVIPNTILRRTSRWLRKHKGVAATITAATIGIAILSIGSNFVINSYRQQAVTLAENEKKAKLEVVKEKDQKEIASKRLKSVRDFMVTIFRKPDSNIDGREIKVASVLESATAKIEGLKEDDPVGMADQAFAISEIYHLLGLYDEAAKTAELALEVYETEFTDVHENTIETLSHLVDVYRVTGKYDLAIKTAERALKVAPQFFGPEDREMLVIQNNLGLTFEKNGKFKEAVAIHGRILSIRQKLLGDENEETLNSINSLAQSHKGLKEFEKGAELLEPALKTARSSLDENSFLTMVMMNNLADCYSSLKRPDDATPLLSEAIELMKVNFGPTHPSTLIATTNLARAHRLAKNYDRSFELYQKAIDGLEATVGESNPTTILTLNNFGMAYTHADRIEDAIPLLERSTELARIHFGDDYYLTKGLKANLANQYKAVNEYDDSRIEQMKKSLGTDHELTLVAMNNLSIINFGQGKIDRALELMEESLDLAVENWGDSDKRTLESASTYCTMLYRLQKWKKAESAMRTWYPIIDASKSDELNAARQSVALGITLVNLGEEHFDEAENLLTSAVVVLEENSNGLPNKNLVGAAKGLVELYSQAKRDDEKENWKQRLEQFEKRAANETGDNPC